MFRRGQGSIAKLSVSNILRHDPPRMGSMMMAAVSDGADCILNIHSNESSGDMQQLRCS
jgi:hypothetical protein